MLRNYVTMISKSTSQDILDYLIKFKNILELFETIMVNNQRNNFTEFS